MFLRPYSFDFRQLFLAFLKSNLLNILLTRRGVELAFDSGRLKTSEMVWTTAQGLTTNANWPTKELSLWSHHVLSSLRNQSALERKDTEKNMALDDCRDKTTQQATPALSDQPVRSTC